MSFLDRFRKPKSIDAPALDPAIANGPTPGDITHPDVDVGPEVIDFLYQSMKIDAEWSIREPRSFTWWGHRLAQRVWAEPVHYSDGYAIVRLVAETDLLRRVPNTRSVAVGLAGLNQHASMSAFVWEPVATADIEIPRESSINLRCVAYAHPETADTVKLLFLAACGLQASDAHIKVDRLVPLLGGQPALSDHPTSGRRPHADDMLTVIERLFAPAGVGPAPFSASDFKAAARPTVLPWIESGSKGARLWGLLRSHDRPSGTGTLTVSAETRHPQLGSGLFTLLSIPFDLEADMLLAVCHELNSEEATGSVRSHFLGAWCPDIKGKGLAFASFIPTAACRPGLIEAIAVSTAAKAAWLTRYLDEARTEMRATHEASGVQHMPQNLWSRSVGRTIEWQAAAALDRIRQLGAQGLTSSEG